MPQDHELCCGSIELPRLCCVEAILDDGNDDGVGAGDDDERSSGGVKEPTALSNEVKTDAVAVALSGDNDGSLSESSRLSLVDDTAAVLGRCGPSPEATEATVAGTLVFTSSGRRPVALSWDAASTTMTSAEESPVVPLTSRSTLADRISFWGDSDTGDLVAEEAVTRGRSSSLSYSLGRFHCPICVTVLKKKGR